jgi:hypothetical protein
MAQRPLWAMSRRVRLEPQDEQVMPAEGKHGEHHLENPRPLWYTPLEADGHVALRVPPVA